MRAGFCIDAFLGQPEALNRLAAYQVLFHDLRRVGWLYMAIPDGIWINDDRRAVFALVEAA